MKTILLRLAFALAPIAPAVMVVLTPTAAEASEITVYADELYELVTTGRPAGATMLVTRAYWEGTNIPDLIGFVAKKIVENKSMLSREAQENAMKNLEGSMAQIAKLLKKPIALPNLPMAPFVIIIDDEEVKRALSPAAGQGGENDEA